MVGGGGPPFGANPNLGGYKDNLPCDIIGILGGNGIFKLGAGGTSFIV